MDDKDNLNWTPEADLDVVDQKEPPFYIVDPWKMYVMMVMKVSLYFVYWFYVIFTPELLS